MDIEKSESPKFDVDVSEGSNVSGSAGFMRFYGLYWKKEFILDDSNTKILAGLPNGWTGSGKIAKNFDRSAMWVNFWSQRGVYVLYDQDLVPVYTGQAGLVRKNNTNPNWSDGNSLGERLTSHKNGKYRNGWEYFSWFGFLDVLNEKEIKNVIRKDDEAAVEIKRRPNWDFKQSKTNDRFDELNLLLDSFEAILIEAFVPKFNSRGENLKGATYVNQLEDFPFFLKYLSER